MLKKIRKIIASFRKSNIHRYAIVKRKCFIPLNTRIGPWTVIDGEGGEVHIGERCSVNASSWIGAGYSRISIGDDVRMGAGVKISCSHHIFSDVNTPIREQGIQKGLDIVIGNDCWLGMGVIICPGVTIGQGVVIGAGSVVLHDIPDFSIAVGSPAKVVKHRIDQSFE